MKDFRTLVIGSDPNAYYLARCYHELTGKKADMLAIHIEGQKPFAFTRYTSIINVKYEGKRGLQPQKTILTTLTMTIVKEG